MRNDQSKENAYDTVRMHILYQLVSAELSGSVGSAPAAQQSFKKLGFVKHLLSVSHAQRGPLPPALQGFLLELNKVIY
jgi:hypothetical protein